MTTTKRVTYTRHEGAEDRVRRAIEEALTKELALDTRYDVQQSMLEAGLNERVSAYYRERDGLLDDLAGAVVSQTRPVIRERDAIHEATRRHQADRLANAPRVAGTWQGVRS